MERTIVLHNIKGLTALSSRKTRTNYSYLQTRKDNQTDKYREYLAQAGDFNNDSTNSRNFFDELNSIDTQWLYIARVNLSRSR